MKKCFLLMFFIVLSFSLSTVGAQEYDLVINQGRVMDPETMFDAIANVGIKDGKIAVITKDKISGKEVIDATGLVVAPGFIDGHQHCIEPYAYRLMLRDGRTTIMDLEIGSCGPKINEFYKKREGNSPLNYGVSVSHEFARAAVLDGFSDWETLRRFAMQHFPAGYAERGMCHLLLDLPYLCVTMSYHEHSNNKIAK